MPVLLRNAISSAQLQNEIVLPSSQRIKQYDSELFYKLTTNSGKEGREKGKETECFCLNILSVYGERGYYIFIKTDNRDGIRTAVFYCPLSPVMRIQGLVNDSVRISL